MHFDRSRERGENFINAYHGPYPRGELIYEAEPDEPIYLSYVSVAPRKRREGVATELVKEFVKDIGKGITFWGYITNTPSFRAIGEMGLLSRVPSSGSLTIIGPVELFNQIPIPLLLVKGGVTTESITISNRIPEEPEENSFEDLFSITFKGRT